MSAPNESADHATPQEPPEVTITTLPFALMPKEYFRVSLRNMFWETWWFFLAIILVALLLLKYIIMAPADLVDVSGYFNVLINGLILIGSLGIFLLVVFIFVCYWRAYHNKAGHIYFQKRQSTISRNQVTEFQTNEGNLWKYKKDQSYGVEILHWCYLFWVAQNMFVFIPKTAIANEQDRMILEKEILPVYPKRKRRIWPGLLYSFGCLTLTILFSIFLSSL